MIDSLLSMYFPPIFSSYQRDYISKGWVIFIPAFLGQLYVGCGIEQVVDGKITNRQAAEVLGLTKRQIIRLKERMKTEGVAGLAHKNRGRIPKHAVPKETKEKVAMLARGPLRDASCQQVAELLEEFYGTTLSAKSVGRILKQAGIPLAHTHRAPKRQKSRDRMPQEGLLAQIDAFLPGFIERFNRRFALAPADPTSAYAPGPSLTRLKCIC